MTAHRFGGKWTDKKLQCLARYLPAYLKVFKKQPWAVKLYIDAFAGTGFRETARDPIGEMPSLLEGLQGNLIELHDFSQGSVAIALGIEPGFDEYHLFEMDDERRGELLALKAENPTKKITIYPGDVNDALPSLLRSVSWRDHRAVVFLDPYGMQVTWKLLSEIAGTKACDVWYLFPTGMGLERMLTRSNLPPESWAQRITTMLGTEEWQKRFYQSSPQQHLFPQDSDLVRIADTSAITEYVGERLCKLFPYVSKNPLPMINSVGKCLYHLYFACHYPIGLKIADHILVKSHGN